MKIMMIANDTDFIYNLRREILAHFISNDIEAVLIANVTNYKKELEEIGCRIINVNTRRNSKNPIMDLVLYHRLLRIIKVENPSVVFTNNIKPNVYAGKVCKKLNIPYTANITGLSKPMENSGVLQKLTIFLYKKGISDANTIFFQNEENKKFFNNRKMVSPNTTEILLPGSGVNLDAHKLSEYPKSDTTIFLFVARIIKEKGIEQYLYTAKEIKSKYPDTEFWICGDCDDKRYLKIIDNAEKAGYVKYFGHQKDIDEFFKKASCLVHPSYYPEGMSNVILEAAANGRPVISTNRSGCREAVDDGITGYTVPTENGQAIANVVEKFLALSYKERRQMGLAARRKVEQEFDRNVIIGKYDELYNAIQK